MSDDVMECDTGKGECAMAMMLCDHHVSTSSSVHTRVQLVITFLYNNIKSYFSLLQNCIRIYSSLYFVVHSHKARREK